MKFSTKAIHIGSEPDPTTGAVMPPIYMTSTYAQESPGVTQGYDYTRGGNPNFVRLEKLLASLENADHATVFSSGLGALTGMISLLSAGDKVLAIDGLYGGTYRLFTSVFKRYGIQFVTVMPKDVGELERMVKEEQPQWLFFETPTNPLLEVFDIAAYAEVARECGVLTVVDNTFATPYFQNPLDLGADLVWHSTTKYLNGHSDLVGGVVMTRDGIVKEKLDFARMAIGLNPSPFDVWLTMRGVKTLALRMEKAQANAMALAKFLEDHPKVGKVYYPGLESHRNYALAKQQMSGFSGMISAEFKGSQEQIVGFIGSFKFFTLAESLGGIESLVSHPATMTHASIPREERLKVGITDGLVRFSVGIEDNEDLLEDLASTLI